MDFIISVYFSKIFWAVFLFAGLVAVVLIKMKRLHLVKMAFGAAFWGIFLILVVGMLRHEANVSRFVKKVEFTFLSAGKHRLSALAQGEDKKYGVQIDMLDGTSYLITDVSYDSRRINLYRQGDESKKIQEVPLRKIIYNDHKLSEIVLEDHEEDLALKKGKILKQK